MKGELDSRRWCPEGKRDKNRWHPPAQDKGKGVWGGLRQQGGETRLRLCLRKDKSASLLFEILVDIFHEYEC